MAVTGAHEACLVLLAIGVRRAPVSVVALVMLLAAAKGQRVAAIKAVPAVISAFLSRQAG